MSSFDSLTLACEDWFDKPLCDLPDTLRNRVEDEFLPMPWDKLSAEGRRSVTLQLDYYDDPKKEPVREFYWNQSERRISIMTQIGNWEVVATPTASDLALKEARLAELGQELTRIEAEVFLEDAPLDNSQSPAELKRRKTSNENLQVNAITAATVKARGSTVRREAGKLGTQDMYKGWQKAYRTVKKERPNMSGIWYSQHIAKLDIAKNRDAETIRKHMKS